MFVQTENLTKRYGPRIVAVDGMNLRVRAGEVYGFLGPNGAGKTTTLRILLGLARPTSGSVTVLGRPPGHPEGLARIGALIEGPAFYPYLSGRDNLRVVARYGRVPHTRVDDALAAVDLTDRARDRYTTYSLGMKQRLGVAAALLKDPELLILDEPTNGLDPAGMRDMRALIRELGTGDRTVLLSSHLLGEVEQICDRVGVIADGRLVAQSTVSELRGQESVRVVAHPAERARGCLERLLGPDRVTVDDDGALRLRADTAKASWLVRELVAADVGVEEIHRVDRALEDVFFELTGERGHPRGGSDGR